MQCRSSRLCVWGSSSPAEWYLSLTKVMEWSWSLVATTLLLNSSQNSSPDLQDRRTSLIHKQPHSVKLILHLCLLRISLALSSQIKPVDKNLLHHRLAHQMNASYTVPVLYEFLQINCIRKKFIDFSTINLLLNVVL